MNEERTEAERLRKEREEQHLYLRVGVVTSANFKAHQGFDLTSWEEEGDSPANPTFHRVLRTSTISEFSKIVADGLNLPAEHIRLWAMVNRQNKTTRPDQPILDPDMSIDAAFTKHGSRDKVFKLWAEEASSIENGKPIWPEIHPATMHNSNATILIFLKYFDAENQTLKGAGHVYMTKQQKVADMFPLIQEVMGWTSGANHLTNGDTKEPSEDAKTTLLFEEIKHSMIEPMKPKATLQQAELQDGDIVCFQKVLSEKQLQQIDQAGGYTDARDFYDHLLNRKTILFSAKNIQDKEKDIFKLELSRKMVYEQFSAKVGEHLKIDPTHIRFYTVNSTTGKVKAPVKRNVHQNLFQIMNPQFSQYTNSNQRDDALYYEVLDMSLSELDTKKTMKVTWVTEGISKEVKILSAKALRLVLINWTGVL